jgi:hypothetical protein
MPTTTPSRPAYNGGRGTNQYQTRTRPPASPPSPTLLEQTTQKPVRCRDIWVGGCQKPVQPPDWAHDKHPNVQLIWQTAQNTSTPPEVLAHVARHFGFEIRVQVAANRNISPQTLKLLSHDTDGSSRVRTQVARNPSTPPAILKQLSRDPDYAVRESAAANPNTPLHTLERLLRDQNKRVTQTAAANPSLPKATLAMWQLTR